jgi:translation initiation factor 3 subunit M
VSPEVRALAAKGAAGAVRNPIVSFMERHNLVGLQAVAALKGDKEHGALYDLLLLLATGKLRDYLAWHKDHGSVLAKYPGLEHSNLVTSMRLLSLCSLATEHSEIPYAAIASDLDVPKEEVEAWVVRTISAKLIEAKMDQLSETVLISKCVHRVFGPEQWRVLQAKLASWKTNIKGILDTIAKANSQQSR